MYTILVFVPEELHKKLRDLFNPELCRLIHVEKAMDFYSIAYSRVFDLWIVHQDCPEYTNLEIDELLNNHGTPALFFIHKTQGQDSSSRDSLEKIHTFAQDNLENSPSLFFDLMENRARQNQERYLAGYIDQQPGLEAIVTKSPAMQSLIDLIKDVAPTESPILLVGETGTGKELFANIFHNESRRRSGPFMAVNCGALPDSLLESELFGYEKGAFTGANVQRKGKIEHASGGTLFLDELEEMSPAMQNRLLRVLQERTLHRLGGSVDINTDFRVIAATNADPAELLSSGRLRSDLYYRLSVFQIHIPPLRERTEDIPILVQHFINTKKRNGREFVKGLDHQCMNLLLTVPWFGNVRELQNVLERAVMLAIAPTITPDLIRIPGVPIADTSVDVSKLTDTAFRPGTTLKSYKNLLSQSAERKYLVELLEYSQGHIGEASQFAGLTPRALYNKMKIHGLKKENFKKKSEL